MTMLIDQRLVRSVPENGILTEDLDARDLAQGEPDPLRPQQPDSHVQRRRLSWLVDPLSRAVAGEQITAFQVVRGGPYLLRGPVTEAVAQPGSAAPMASSRRRPYHATAGRFRADGAALGGRARVALLGWVVVVAGISPAVVKVWRHRDRS